MRKHFLILMLLTLLPFTAWADDYSTWTVTLLESSSTYDGSAKTAPTVQLTKTNETPVTITNGNEGWTLTWSSADWTNAGTNTLTVTNSGTHIAPTANTATYTINPLNLNIKAKNVEATYGASYATLAAGTTFYEKSTTTDPDIPGGVLSVIPSFKEWDSNTGVNSGKDFTIQATVTNSNYTVTVTNAAAKVKINKKTLIVRAAYVPATAPAANTITYTGAVPALKTTWEGLIPDDVATKANPSDPDEPKASAVNQQNLDYTIKTTGAVNFYAENGTYNNHTAGIVGDVETYQVKVQGLSADNYTFNYIDTPLELIVAPKALTEAMIQQVCAGTKTYNGGYQPAVNNTDRTDVILQDAAKYGTDKTIAAADFDIETWNADASAKIAANAVMHAGTYTVKIIGKHNYSGTVSKTFAIAKKLLNVITTDDSHDYDNATPGLTIANISFNGLANVDKDATITSLPAKEAYVADYSASDATTAATTEFDFSLSTAGAKNAGQYGINAFSKENRAATAIFKDYNVNYVNTGRMTINKIQVTLKPKNVTIQYGDQEPDWAHATAANFDIAYYFKAGGNAALVGTDKVDKDVFTTMPVIERVVPSGKTAGDVGEYVLNAISYVVKADGNYELKAGEPKTGKLTIQPATSITILVDNVKAVYGQYANQEALDAAGMLTYRVSGVKTSEKNLVHAALSVVDGTSKPFAGKRGEYTIKVGEVTLDPSIAANYDGVTITRIDGTLNVTKAPLQIRAKNQSHVVGDEVTAASLDNIDFITDLTNEEKEAVLAGITLKWGTALSADTYYSSSTKKLLAAAATKGYDGTNYDESGIWIGGIAIDATTYNGNADVNYTLDSGEAAGASAAAGNLYVSDGTYVTFDATATGSNTVSTLLAANNNKTIKVKVILRRDQTVGGNAVTWRAKEWNTMVLPFDISVADLSSALGYAIVNVVKPEATTGDKVKFQLEMDAIPANTPFAVKTTNAITNAQVIDFGLQTIKYEANPAKDAGADNIFHGAYTSMDITSANPEYRFCAGNVWPHIDAAGSTFVVRPFNAYMEIDAANLARDIVFEFEELDGSTTAIKSVNIGSSKAYEADGWYTINGMKLNAAPTEKGIYINNGKKVVVK